MPSILIVEDDREIANSLQHDLQAAGYQTMRANTLRQTLTRARRYLPDLVLLDLTLPDANGLDALLRLRCITDAPIIILKTNDTTYRKAELLRSGANDAILKPCHAAELLIHVSVHGRVLATDILTVRDFHLFPFTRQVTCSGKPLHLSRREFDLLELLMRHPAQVFSRKMIFEVVWGKESAPTSNIVDIRFSKLRRKLEGAGVYILCTVRGVGYAFEPSLASDQG